MSDKSFNLIVAGAAGAFVTYTYLKLRAIEHVLTDGEGQHTISMSSLIDLAKNQAEDDEDSPPVGFSGTPGKLRRKNAS